MVKRFFQRFYVGIIFFILYSPIAVLIGLSFNKSKSMGKWGGFTINWYTRLFSNGEIMDALLTTFILALLSAFIATVLGTMASIGINNMSGRGKAVTIGVSNIPLLNADIVTGVAMMLLLIRFMNLGFTSILIAHISFCVPYVILSVMPRLSGTNKNTYEAALDLGASHLQAFFKIVLPDIMPGVISGFLLSFTMSLDDFTITYFTKGPGINTLSTMLYTELKKGIKPELYALSTLMFLAVLIILFIINKRPATSRTAKVNLN